MDFLSTCIRGIALEEVADGKSNKEIEHVFYGRITDFSVLERATGDIEEHEQWELKIPKTNENATRGGIRIRRTYIVGGRGTDQYVLTTKTYPDGSDTALELPVPTTRENFLQFQALSSRGMIKHRYPFKVEGTDLVFEVDMFLKPGSKMLDKDYFEWCKIDLEVTDRSAKIPPLPFELADMIPPKALGPHTQQQSDQIKQLYETMFIRPNIFL